MKTEKTFDAVKMMRGIRDRLSKKFANMDYKEQKKYIEEKNKIRDDKEKQKESNSLTVLEDPHLLYKPLITPSIISNNELTSTTCATSSSR